MSLKRTTRRRFILTSLATGTALTACSELKPAKLSKLQALVDTIVPADSTPGALHYGVDLALQETTQQSTRLANSLSTVLDYFELKAGPALNDLSLEQREQALGSLLIDKSLAAERQALRYLRRFVLDRYYTQVEVQRSLGYTVPSSNPNY